MSNDDFRQAALAYHRHAPKGKIKVMATKPMLTSTSTDADGNFTLRGLPPGKTVYIRINGSLIGKGASSVSTPFTTPGSGGTDSVGTLTVPD